MKKTLLLPLFFCLLIQFSFAQPTKSFSADSSKPSFLKKISDFEKFVKTEMEKRKIPGLTIGFTIGKETWIKSFGYSDMENKVRTKNNSSYRMASVQKSMTATAIMQLVEEKKINLDSPVQKYIQYYPIKKYPVTIRQILLHTSGIPHYVDATKEKHIKVHKTTREAIELFKDYELVSEPGTKYVYSSNGYNLLGAVIEEVTGISYAQYMKEKIWHPLKMNDTQLDNPLLIIPNRVRGYELVNDSLQNSEFIDISSRFAAGGTRTTVPDMLKFLNGISQKSILSKTGIDTMLNPVIFTSQKELGLGHSFAWTVLTHKLGKIYVNDGGQPETRTFILLFPDKGITIAFAMNLEADVYGEIIQHLFVLLTGERLF